MIEKCEPITHLFDAVHQLWDHRRTQRAFATLIFFIYLAGLLGIEANRQGVLPPWLEHITPMSHFQAIHLAFTLILGMEVMELILTISGSLSKSLGKQFEVMALILLRDAFKELSKLPEPVSLTSGIEPVVHIASAGLGALIIFICLGFYYQLRTHQNYITNPEEQMRYVMSKKLISLVLFLLFVGIAVRDLILFVQTGNDADFFETIYTILIFADIALVLISQRFHAGFSRRVPQLRLRDRTLIMRLSLSAPLALEHRVEHFCGGFCPGPDVGHHLFRTFASAEAVTEVASCCMRSNRLFFERFPGICADGRGCRGRGQHPGNP